MVREVVITGIGMVTPIGIGRVPFWDALMARQSGVASLQAFDSQSCASKVAGEVRDFEPKQYVRPRKSLKVMSRDIQLGFAAADLAMTDSGLQPDQIDPERMGVIYGADMIYCDLESVTDAFRTCIVDGKFDFSRWGGHAISSMYPLWLLKYLPNMPACHIGIAHDARGPNNSITVGDVSSLLAVAEAMRVIERGLADVMISGGSGSKINPTSYHFRWRGLSRRDNDPAGACRPFEASRDGTVNGEGSAAFVLESREHAAARGATILARVVSYASTFEPAGDDGTRSGTAIRTGIGLAMDQAGIVPDQIDHVNAHGVATVADDRIEAHAIRDTLGDIPVTALKSFFGNLGAGSGAVEMAATVLGLVERTVPVTLNYETPDPECPVQIIQGVERPVEKNFAMVLNQAPTGQAAAVLLAAE